jgi:hypothetical protein
MIPPRKPFQSYKWRWAVVTPTEGLDVPAVYLGVLRTLRQFEGHKPNDAGFVAALAVVEAQTRSTVDLSRNDDRNLIRNSGQYWKALGLLEETQPIQLTPFGRRVADGLITRDEFAAATIKTLELPNARIDSQAAQWRGLRIRPLALLLEIMQGLAVAHGGDQGSLTEAELVNVVIPLAGTVAPMAEYTDSLRAYRDGRLDLTNWPDCAPAANDRRMAREFLLFLYHYGVVSRTGVTRAEERYYLVESELSTVQGFNEIVVATTVPATALTLLRGANAAELVPREVITAKIKARPQQPRFRREVLAASGHCCLITGERMPEVLEAAHLIPIESDGTDNVGNGICLRADIHRLFDAGHIRIRADGRLQLSEQMANSTTYAMLPVRIALPAHVAAECINWRWNYE